MSPRAPIAIALVLASSFAAAGLRPEDPRVAVADAFLESLDETQRGQASFAVDDVERTATTIQASLIGLQTAIKIHGYDADVVAPTHAALLLGGLRHRGGEQSEGSH